MKIKICGLRREEDIDYVNQAHPDYAGFVFAKSRRQVDNHQAKAMRERLDPSIPAVGVFVNAPLDEIKKLVCDHVIQIVQLHGQEDQAYIDQVKTLQVPIIKAMAYNAINDYQNIDFALIDQITPGSGQRFDWQVLKGISRPYFLAGGISLENVDEALKTDAYALDVSSGVETDGYKDFKKIDEIVRRAHKG